MKNLWGSRFQKQMDQMVEEFNASITFDIALYKQDIRGSIAHAKMLSKMNHLTEEELEQIITGLQKIEKKIEEGSLSFTYEDEDIHMAVESQLIKEIGDVGRKLHTARSRNDQVILDVRLYLKEEMEELFDIIQVLLKTLMEKAESHKEMLMPGFTHLQHAQPVTVGFHLMAYFQQFKRDLERLKDCYKRTDYNPLGACALAGTTIPIDRSYTADLLGFQAVTENAMDTVADRDFIVEFLSVSSLFMAHLSRLSEEFILWNAQEFSFIEIDDGFCTGSSIMPQKKNPDIPELIRGKTGRVYGHLLGLLTVLKGLPMAFNKDFQEDKEALFDTVKTVKTSAVIFSQMLENTTFKEESIKKHMDKGFLAATDLAEYLVTQGVPFRTSHELVGAIVKYCEKTGETLMTLKDEVLPDIDGRLQGISLPDLSSSACIHRRSSFGGTSPADVMRQIEKGKEVLEWSIRNNEVLY